MARKRLAATLGLSAACGTSLNMAGNRPAAAPSGQVDLVGRICAGRCGGPGAQVAAWTKASRQIALYLYDGDINRCSHPPRIYYDGDGREVGAMGSGPVAADQEAPGPALHARLTAGLTEGWTRSCSAGSP